MNFRKHFAGIALFFVIFSSTVFIFNYLIAPLSTIPPPVFDHTRTHRPFGGEQRQQIKYKVRMVSLDFNTKESYTTLALKREAGQSLPERLWVRTSFFIPESNGRVQWDETVEISVPDVDADRLEVTARSLCERCQRDDTPGSGYFARVFVSTEPIDDGRLDDSAINLDRNAIPVLVQAERKTNRFARR